MNKIEILKRSELFRDLNDEQLAVVEKKCTHKVFEPGAIICRQDAKQDDVFIIEEGLIGVMLGVGPLTERQVQAASRFEVVGWSALIEPFVCRANARALEKTNVLAFKGEDLRSLCASHPVIGCKLYHQVARVVAVRLHYAFTQLLGVTAQV